MATLSGKSELREVVLVFSGATSSVPIDTTLNIQTGVYLGTGSPATVKGDATTTLPATSALFNGNAEVQVSLNGVLLDKGGTGRCSVEWVSTTQLKLPGNRIFQNNKLAIRAPNP